MILKTFLVLFAMALTSEAQIVPQPLSPPISQFKCPSGYACLKLCSHPDFKKCANFFPTLYNPSFCALSKQGKWKSQTFACAACKKLNVNGEPNVIGVIDGKCSCQLEGCPQNQTCIDGRCVNLVNLCASCSPIQKCIDGRCVKLCARPDGRC